MKLKRNRKKKREKRKDKKREKRENKKTGKKEKDIFGYDVSLNPVSGMEKFTKNYCLTECRCTVGAQLIVYRSEDTFLCRRPMCRCY